MFVPANNVVVLWRIHYTEISNSSTCKSVRSKEWYIDSYLWVCTSASNYLTYYYKRTWYFTAITQLKASSENLKVPTIYWLNKLQNQPFEFHFLIASSKEGINALYRQASNGNFRIPLASNWLNFTVISQNILIVIRQNILIVIRQRSQITIVSVIFGKKKYHVASKSIKFFIV